MTNVSKFQEMSSWPGLRALVEGKRKNVSPHEVSAQR